MYAYWITKNYRESYNIFASNGILFNHESPLRGETFVTRKITRAVAMIKSRLQSCLYVGNLNARRDWGHAKDYVEGMWSILQHSSPDDFVLATGRTETIRFFIEKAFSIVDIPIKWEGKGLEEFGINTITNDIIIRVDSRYFRPAEVDLLVGDYAKANNLLDWNPKISLEDIIIEMVEEDLKSVTMNKKR